MVVATDKDEEGRGRGVKRSSRLLALSFLATTLIDSLTGGRDDLVDSALSLLDCPTH